ncbi:DNA-directed RNA polymerase [Pseudomonas sp. SID14000]|uniref:DNA-directed RNA polymerase n=1 Tax=Pseudomonas sp. SID14000 TaxID=1986221 RepID=UPI000B3C28C7|nr:DNA-directed RNA polymerase [Pseudomonas sp. SID14000]
MSVLLPEQQDFSDIKHSPKAFETLSRLYGEDLAALQLSLEHEAYVLGEERFRKGLEAAMASGEYADTTTAKPVLEALVPMFVARYNEWLEHQNTKVRRKHVAIDKFRVLKPEVAAIVTIKRTLGILASTSGTHTVQRVAISIGQSIEDELRFGRIREQEAQHFKRVIRPALDRRNGHLYKKEFMKAVETNMATDGQLDTWLPWEVNRADIGKDEHFQVGIKLMEILIESSGLIEVVRENAGHAASDCEAVHLHPAWAEKLSQRAFSLAGIAPVHQPCVVPPKKWVGVRGGGYWAQGRKPVSLIRVRTKRALDRYRDVHMPEVVKAVNLAQESAWSVNLKVLEVANALSEWQNVPIDDFPALAKEELPMRPEDIDENEASLKVWKKDATKVYRREKARSSRRLRLEFTLAQANKFSEYEAIWFPYNMDWRGRVYALPMFNPQGNDMTKGLLQAAHGEPIGAEGKMWLAIHGANTAGVDKVGFAERLKWVEDNQELILACAADPLTNTEWMSMDSPFCFLAFCFEWAGVQEHGEAWVSRLPIAFDGSCSGIQHFSAMLRDERGGRAVNLLPSTEVQDIYRLVAHEVILRMQVDMEHGTEDQVELVTDEKTGEIREVRTIGTRTLAKGWDTYGVTRSTTKRSVMTLPYGSKEFGFADQLMVDIIRPAIDRGQGHMFTHPDQFARYLAKHIWDSVSVVVVASVEAMEWLQRAAKLMASTVKDKKTKEVLKPCMAVHWITPDGFPVWQEYFTPVKRRVDLMFLGSHRMQATVNVRDSEEMDPRKMESGVSPNFVHSQDGSHLRKTVVKAREAYSIEFFALIHDSFGTIPAKAGGMFRAVRETMVETYENNDVLADFREQFMDQLHESQLDKMPPLPASGSLDLQEILKSEFAFA